MSSDDNPVIWHRAGYAAACNASLSRARHARSSGTQFDRKVAEAMLDLLREGRLAPELLG